MRRFVSKDSKRDFYILYTLVFGVIAGFIYYQFAGNGKSLVWSHDGIPQHLNSLAYYGRYLREVLHTIFVEHKLELPMWDMNIWFGSDILTTLHYYVIGDPLTLLSVFVPADKTEVMYEVLIFLRIYLAGIYFSVFCFCNIMILKTTNNAFTEVIENLHFSLDHKMKTATLLPKMNEHYSGDIILPEKVKDNNGVEYSVIALEDSCFENCNGLTSIDIPSSVTSLGDHCFYNCNGLTCI